MRRPVHFPLPPSRGVRVRVREREAYGAYSIPGLDVEERNRRGACYSCVFRTGRCGSFCLRDTNKDGDQKVGSEREGERKYRETRRPHTSSYCVRHRGARPSSHSHSHRTCGMHGKYSVETAEAPITDLPFAVRRYIEAQCT